MRNLGLILIFVGNLAFSQANSPEKAYFSGDYSSALTLLEQNSESTDDPHASLLKALCYWKLDRFTESENQFAKALSLDQSYYEAYFHFANFLLDTKQYDRSLFVLNYLLNNIDRSETKAIFFKIDKFGQEGTQISSLVGMKADILSQRAKAYQLLDRSEEALADISIAISLSERSDLLVQRGLIYSELGKTDLARTDFTTAINLDPSSSLAWYNLLLLEPTTQLPDGLTKDSSFAPLLAHNAILMINNGQYDEAKLLLESAMELEPTNPIHLLNMGRLQNKKGEFEQAIQLFKKALQVDPQKSESLYLLGNAYFGLKRYDQAIDYYRKYLLTDPTYADVWYNAGMSYFQIGEKSDGCKCLERALAFGMKRADSIISSNCENE